MTSKNPSKGANCGTNSACLRKNLLACKSASGMVTVLSDDSGELADLKTKLAITVKEKKDGVCTFEYAPTDFTFAYTKKLLKELRAQGFTLAQIRAEEKKNTQTLKEELKRLNPRFVCTAADTREFADILKRAQNTKKLDAGDCDSSATLNPEGGEQTQSSTCRYPRGTVCAGISSSAAGAAGTSPDAASSASGHFTDDQGLISFDYPPDADQAHGTSPTLIGGVTFQAFYHSGKDRTEPNSWNLLVLGVPITDVEYERGHIVDASRITDSEYSHFADVAETTLGGERALQYSRAQKASDDQRKSLLLEAVHGSMLYSVGVSMYDKNNAQAVQEATDAFTAIRNSFRFLK